MYFDAARANYLLMFYEKLEAAATDVCDLFPDAQPFGNLATALRDIRTVKKTICAT
jgi:hypothetical protein